MSEETAEAPALRYATFADLMPNTEPETADVALESGAVVTVRGMTRFEIHLGGKNTDDAAVIEARNLSYAVVEPRLTYEMALAWIKAARAGGDIARVSRTIRDLSGLGPGADKSNQ